eukprot:860906-Rhodomonas_salina.1
MVRLSPAPASGKAAGLGSCTATAHAPSPLTPARSFPAADTVYWYTSAGTSVPRNHAAASGGSGSGGGGGSCGDDNDGSVRVTANACAELSVASTCRSRLSCAALMVWMAGADCMDGGGSAVVAAVRARRGRRDRAASADLPLICPAPH